MNIGWLTAERILRLTAGVFVGVWVARYLGPEQYGMLNYAFAFVALFAAFSTLGLDGIVVRNIVRNPGKADESLGTAFVLKLAGGLITFALTVTLIALIRRQDVIIRSLTAIIAMGTIFNAFDTIDFWFQAQVASKYTVIAKSVAFALASAAKVYLILVKAPLIYFAMVATGEIILGALAIVLAYHLYGSRMIKWKATLKQAKNLLGDSWPLILSGLAIMGYMRIDQIMLGQMSGNEFVGIYSAAVKLAEVWYFIPLAIVSSTFPAVVKAREVSNDLYYHRLQQLYNLMVIIAYSIAIPVTFLSNYFVRLLYGRDYQAAGIILAIYIWAGLWFNLQTARDSFIQAENLTKLHTVSAISGMVINVLLNYLLIPGYHGLGAALATFFSYSIAGYFSNFLIPPLQRTGWMQTKAILFPLKGLNILGKRGNL